MSYDDVIFADNPILYCKLEESILPTSLPNALCIESVLGTPSSLIPGFGITQGIPGPILSDPSSFGTSGAIARIPNVGNSSVLQTPTHDLSFEAWAKCTGSSCETIINHGGDTSTIYMAFGQRSSGLFADQLYFVLDFGLDGGRDLISCPAVENEWHHCVGTLEGSRMRLWLDAWIVDERNDCPLLTPIDFIPHPWRMGYITNLAFGPSFWSAGMSHAAVYNYALSGTQILTHYLAAGVSEVSAPCAGAISVSTSISPSASPSSSPSSSPSASPQPCTPPEGRAVACINSKGRLFVTLLNDDGTANAYAWHEGAQRMPISSQTNWKGSMRALTLQEMGVAFETDNPDADNPLIVSVHRNLRKNYVRDARVTAGSNRIDSATAGFDSDHINDMAVVFGENIGGPGIHYLLGRIEALASPSASPSPSSSPSASPSTTESASPSASASASPSSSRSGSPSPSHSPSASPSASPSRSISQSPSATTSASPSASPSSSQSASPSAS